MSRPAPSPANQTRSKTSHEARAAFFRSLTTFRSPLFDAVVRGSDLVARRQDAREEDARGGQGPKLGDAALERDEIVRQTDDRFLELLHLLGRARDRRRDLLDLLPVPGGEGRLQLSRKPLDRATDAAENLLGREEIGTKGSQARQVIGRGIEPLEPLADGRRLGLQLLGVGFQPFQGLVRRDVFRIGLRASVLLLGARLDRHGARGHEQRQDHDVRTGHAGKHCTRWRVCGDASLLSRADSWGMLGALPMVDCGGGSGQAVEEDRLHIMQTAQVVTTNPPSDRNIILSDIVAQRR